MRTPARFIASPSIHSEDGRSTLTWILQIVGGLALFIIMAMVGFAIADQRTDDASPVAVAEFSPVASDTPEANAQATEDLYRNTAVVGLSDLGALDDPAVAAAAAAGGDGVAGSASGISARTLPPPIDPTEPQPVPAEVIEDDPALLPFVVWDDLDLSDFVQTIRIDVCAGATPGLPFLPGCPSGEGATIVPLEDDPYPELEAPFTVKALVPNALECGPLDGVFRAPFETNRPARIVISAWNGTRSDGPIPPSVQSTTIATSDAKAEAWYAAVEGDPSLSPPITYCVEMPWVTTGLVNWVAEAESTYLPDASATDADREYWSWYNRGAGKPPSALVALTSDTLYVRAWNQSSVDEQIFVQARPTSEAGCDNRGDIASVGSGPGFEQAVLDRTIPFDGDMTGWPWAPTWDRMEIHRLHLERGTPYDVCIFWVNDTGPSFNPSSVTRTEVAQVVPPSLSDLAIHYSSAEFADWIGSDPRINRIEIDADVEGCAPVAWTTNTAETKVYIFGYSDAAPQPCGVEHVGAIQSQGGFSVTVRATDSLGDEYQRTSWVRVQRNLLRCGEPCGDEYLPVHIPMPFVADRTIRGYSDAGQLDTSVIGAEPVPGEVGPPVGEVRLGLGVTPVPGGNSRRWFLGDIGEIDQSAPRAPLRPQLDVTTSYPRIGPTGEAVAGIYLDASSSDGGPSANIQFDIVADRPVTMSASLASPSGSLCVHGAAPVTTQESAASVTTHTLEFTGLCPFTLYDLVIDARDDAGTAAVIYESDTVDGVTALAFRTAPVPLKVYGEFSVDVPASMLETANSRRVHVGHGDLYLSGHSARISYVDLEPEIVGRGETRTTGWASDAPYRSIMCEESWDVDYMISESSPRTGLGASGNFSDTGRVRLAVEMWKAPTANVNTPSGVRICSRPQGPITTYQFDEFYPVADLINGVELVSDDGIMKLRVQGRLSG